MSDRDSTTAPHAVARDLVNADAGQAECLPANNLERWSPIPAANRLAVQQALARFAHPARLQRPRCRAPFQTAVRALGAPYGHLVRSTLAGYCELGSWLLYLCEHTRHGLWLRAFRDSKDPVEEPLPMTRQQAEAFMRLAREPAVLDPRNWERLPRGWTVVDAIVRGARRSRQPVQDLINAGTVHPAMTRSEAQALAVAPSPRAERRQSAEWNLDRALSAVVAAVYDLLEGCPLTEVEQALRLCGEFLANQQLVYRFDHLDPEDRAWLLAWRARLAQAPQCARTADDRFALGLLDAIDRLLAGQTARPGEHGGHDQVVRPAQRPREVPLGRPGGAIGPSMIRRRSGTVTTAGKFTRG